jgi:hypothetical protein
MSGKTRNAGRRPSAEGRIDRALQSGECPPGFRNDLDALMLELSNDIDVVLDILSEAVRGKSLDAFDAEAWADWVSSFDPFTQAREFKDHIVAAEELLDGLEILELVTAIQRKTVKVFRAKRLRRRFLFF